jgi:hypothetical protein
MIRRLLLLACLGAGCLPAQLQLFILQPGQASTEAPAPQNYSFGTVSVLDARDVEFSLMNTGTASTPLTTLSVGAPFLILGFDPTTLPQSVSPGASVSFTVSFAPTEPGQFSATLAADGVTMTGTAISGVAISVSSGGAPAQLQAGAAIDFGSVAQGSTVTQQVVMTNPLENAITVQNVAVINLQGASFELETAWSPVSLAPGATATLTVVFTPTSDGPQQAALEVDQLSIPLTGVGLDPPFPPAMMAFSNTTAASSQQDSLTVTLSAPAPANGIGQIQITFQPNSPGTNQDSAIVFIASGSQTAQFSVNQGDPAGYFGTTNSIAFQTGTTAGTITFTLTLGAVTAIQTLTIAPAEADITSGQAQRTSGGLDVQFQGFDNTQSASTVTFTFLDVSGAVLSGGAIAVDAAADFLLFFASSDEGGLFALDAFFPVTVGTPSQVDSVEVQVANAAGTTPTTRLYFTTP